VKERLQTGSTVTWGFHPEKGDAVTAEFTVVESDLGERIESIRKRLEDPKPSVLRQIVAQLYLGEGLACAAYEEARAVADQTPSAKGALAIMQAALIGMELEESPLWNDLRRRVAGLEPR
ncbi:MAG: hypothetical protein ACYTGV_12855, partial [Planctomycetota bacterium]